MEGSSHPFGAELGDALLRSIRWLGEGDLELSFEVAGGQSLRAFRFEWVTSVAIDLDFQDRSGAALVFQAAARRSDRGWEVSIDFAGAPAGAITFCCNDIQAVVD